MYQKNPLEISSQNESPSKERMIALIEGREKPANYYETQVSLAVELFKRDYAGVLINPQDEEERNEIMRNWELKGFSTLFGEYAKKVSDPTAITLDDLFHFQINPEEVK